MAKIQSEHVWPKDIVECCEVLGRVLLSAIRRRDAEVKLQDRFHEISQLKDRLEQENTNLREEIELFQSHSEIIGNSRAIRSVLRQAEQVAGQDTSVLVLGETGTGKELLARAIHDMSPRKGRAMITVNCAALPATLIEGELFGRALDDEGLGGVLADAERLAQARVGYPQRAFVDEQQNGRRRRHGS